MARAPWDPACLKACRLAARRREALRAETRAGPGLACRGRREAARGLAGVADHSAPRHAVWRGGRGPASAATAASARRCVWGERGWSGLGRRPLVPPRPSPSAPAAPPPPPHWRPGGLEAAVWPVRPQWSMFQKFLAVGINAGGMVARPLVADRAPRHRHHDQGGAYPLPAPCMPVMQV